MAGAYNLLATVCEFLTQADDRLGSEYHKKRARFGAFAFHALIE